MYAVYPWILEFLSVASTGISKYLALPCHDNLHHREHTTKPGTPSPTSCELCGVSFFLSPTEYIEHINFKGCEMGLGVYRPYPRRLEIVTICRCHYKGSTFSSVIIRL